MTEPAHTSPPPVVRLQWTLLQPLLAALSEAGVPLRPGDLDQLQHAAAIGPEFAHALARWIRAAHTASAPSPAWPAPAVRSLAPRPERPALDPAVPPAVPDRHAS
ncbi:hypothetical protein [Streptomyces sp. TLI_171]|uniref:hypothetical protein n=1 Tax=Streptomyces sp. TLI_171 TaxID=1938859 RepID=UPI000C1A5F02|nr:hypothetical protein [Streptomyces sp. TLI_171]RKE17420.1 hypothetical protein BX266_0676 [Streptomyces sp. TLI_171]